MHKANRPSAPVASLSSKLQGLKFMQRGGALNPQPAPAPSPSAPPAVKVKQEAEASGSQAGAAAAAPVRASRGAAGDSVTQARQMAGSGSGNSFPVRADGTEDGNAEHWVLSRPTTSAPRTSRSALDEPDNASAVQSFGRLGWNDWLAAEAAGRGNSRAKGKRKASDVLGSEEEDDDDEQEAGSSKKKARRQAGADEDEDEDAGDGDDENAELAVAPAVGGRRTFGAWASSAKSKRRRRKSGEDGEDDVDGEEEEDEGVVKIKEAPSTHNRFNAIGRDEASSKPKTVSSASSGGLRKKGPGGANGSVKRRPSSISMGGGR